MGKGLKEFQLCDSRRLRKKPQHAQDDVTWTVRFVWCPFLGLEKYIEFGLPKAVLPSSARGCLCHPSCLLWFHVFWRTFEAAGCVPSVMSQPQKQDCHTLQRVDLARPFLVSPAIKIEIENSLEMALSKAKSGSAWQSHFWQCGTLRPARNTKLLHYTQVNQSWVLFKQQASTQLGRTTFWSPKSQCVYGPENEIAAVTFLAKNGAALPKSNTFASVTEWQDSGEHGCWLKVSSPACMSPVFAKVPCCLELFGCCCRRLSQHGVGEVLIPLRQCWRDAFSVFAFALLSFVLVSWCVVCFWAPPPSPP